MLPSLFISHSSPLLALDQTLAQSYRQLGQCLGTPSAILIMSAHWQHPELAVGEIDTHHTLIYDFSGFPAALYQLQYAAPGAAMLHRQLEQQLACTVPIIPRGLDHGVWIPLYCMYPEANIPVLQLSLPYNISNRALYQLGQAIAPLRQQNILLIGSGMLTHNLAAWRQRDNSQVQQAAQRFDADIAQLLQHGELEALLNWQQHPDAAINHPSDEHFLPLLFAAGAGGLQQTQTVMSGFEFKLFSRRSVLFG